jgi:hypothetical protein
MESMQLNELEKQRADDLRWALRSIEVRQHAGQLVAVYKKRILGFGIDREALIAQASAKAQCPPQDVVIIVVPDSDLAELPR